MEMYCWSREPSGEIMCTTIIRSGEALRTVTPSGHIIGKTWLGDGDAVLQEDLRFVDVVPGLKVTEIVSRPSPVDCEVM